MTNSTPKSLSISLVIPSYFEANIKMKIHVKTKVTTLPIFYIFVSQAIIQITQLILFIRKTLLSITSTGAKGKIKRLIPLWNTPLTKFSQFNVSRLPDILLVVYQGTYNALSYAVHEHYLL